MPLKIWIAFAVLAVTLFMIMSKRIDRTIGAVVGAIIMLLVGTEMGFYSQEAAIEAVDFNTIGLLLGMMIIVGIMGDSGIFKYVAYKAAQASKGSYYRLLVFFMGVTALSSAFLDNVTTILLMAPITFSIAGTLSIDPKPFLMTEVMASNIGGTATLIGDPPNVMIGSAANISFTQFIIYLGPMIAIIFMVILLYFEIIYEDHLDIEMEKFEEIKEVNPKEKIKDYTLLKKSLFVFSITIVLFFLHHTLHLEPWAVAITGAGLLLLLTFSDPEEALSKVEWSSLLFFVGFFMVIGGVEASGGIGIITDGIQYLGGNSLFRTALVIMWLSAFLSMVIDNIPITMALIAAIGGIIANHPMGGGAYVVNPLWWALSLGACLGGNGTQIGASANIVLSGISEKKGHSISFVEFTKIGLPVAVISLTLASIMLWVFFFLMS